MKHFKDNMFSIHQSSYYLHNIRLNIFIIYNLLQSSEDNNTFLEFYELLSNDDCYNTKLFQTFFNTDYIPITIDDVEHIRFKENFNHFKPKTVFNILGYPIKDVIFNRLHHTYEIENYVPRNQLKILLKGRS